MNASYVGIDIAKATFEVALVADGQVTVGSYRNDTDGISALLAWLGSLKTKPTQVGMEATGRYWEAVANALHAAEYAVSVVNPAQISAFRTAHLKRAKTDKTDARLIATFCQQCQPPRWMPHPPAVHELQALTHHYQALVVERDQVRNRLKSLNPSEFVTRQLQAQLTFLNDQLKALLKQIRTHMQGDDDLKRNRDLLLSIPGLGPVTVAAILGEIGDARQFASADQLAAYAGLCPSVFTSGSSIHKQARLSKTGNAFLRKVLYMPAVVARLHNPRIKALSDRMSTNGKSKMQIIGAAMHKLLRLVFGVLRSQQPFLPLPS
jgi:transposase